MRGPPDNFYDRLAAELHVSRDYAKRTCYGVWFKLETDPWLVYLINHYSTFLFVDWARASRD